ncbi:MAG: hypothetical protein ACE5J0_00915 [Candidatus Paceibacterales bacterium]
MKTALNKRDIGLQSEKEKEKESSEKEKQGGLKIICADYPWAFLAAHSPYKKYLTEESEDKKEQGSTDQ